MPTIAMSGNDTVIINNRIFANLADQDAAVLTYPNDSANVKTGSNGNSIFTLNETGKQADVVLRVIRASDDDKFLNNLFAQQQLNFEGFPLLIGQFVKRIGKGDGEVQKDIYNLSGGIFQRGVDGKKNVEGDTEAAISIWRLKFANAPRAIT